MTRTVEDTRKRASTRKWLSVYRARARAQLGPLNKVWQLRFDRVNQRFCSHRAAREIIWLSYAVSVRFLLLPRAAMFVVQIACARARARDRLEFFGCNLPSPFLRSKAPPASLTSLLPRGLLFPKDLRARRAKLQQLRLSICAGTSIPRHFKSEGLTHTDIRASDNGAYTYMA